jgi:hypothetical protein
LIYSNSCETGLTDNLYQMIHATTYHLLGKLQALPIDRTTHLDVVGRLTPSIKWKPRIHSAPLTRELDRAVALGRVLVLLILMISFMIVNADSSLTTPPCSRRATPSSFENYFSDDFRIQNDAFAHHFCSHYFGEYGSWAQQRRRYKDSVREACPLHP